MPQWSVYVRCAQALVLLFCILAVVAGAAIPEDDLVWGQAGKALSQWRPNVPWLVLAQSILALEFGLPQRNDVVAAVVVILLTVSISLIIILGVEGEVMA